MCTGKQEIRNNIYTETDMVTSEMWWGNMYRMKTWNTLTRLMIDKVALYP